MALLIAVGCASAADLKKVDPKEEKEEVQKDGKRLFTGPGEVTVRSEKGTRPILYILRWEKSQLDYTQEQGASGGRLEKVSGELYQEGKLASRFTADRGTANRRKSKAESTKEVNADLQLEGAVNVVGLEPAGTLRCKKLEWNTEEKLMKAYGQVSIQSESGTIGPLEQLWCLPDLKRAGTPGFYP